MKKRKWLRWTLFGIVLSFFVASFIFVVLTYKMIDKKTPNHAYIKNILGLSFFSISTALLLSSVFYIVVKSVNEKNISLKKRLDTWSEVSFNVSQLGSEISDEIPIGIIVTSSDGTCEWVNKNIVDIFGDDVKGKNINQLDQSLEGITDSKEDTFIISYKEKKYEIKKKIQTNSYYFYDVSEREKTKERYQNKIATVAMISLDNFEQSIQALDVAVQSTVRGSFFAAISDWATRYHCFLKTFGNEKMILIFYKEELNKMIKDNFDILEQIRNISFKNNILVTLSMGIASWDLNFDEVSLYAQNAIELAEKRGGDQVVVNIQNEKIQYFGAKIVQENIDSKVKARVKAENLRKLVNQSSTVFVMGHYNSDTDSYAAMLSVYSMIKADGKDNVYMILEKEKLDQTVYKISRIVENEFPSILNDQLITSQALEIIDQNSFLIVVDTQNKNLVSSPEVFNACINKAVIDHHRATDESFSGIFEYLETTSSSTSELLVELQEFYTSKKAKMNPLLASVLYSGILVDTNNFAYRTGSRTFEAAAKLREYGADINMVRKWIRKDMDRLFKINDLISKAEILFDGKIAITKSEEVVPDNVLAAQVADELLQIDKVEASFAVVNIGDDNVAISARSLGQINVQIIMEQLGGGGHFSAAAAKFTNKNINDIIYELKKCLENEFENEGVIMKIILLEEVKNKGKKDDVVEVPMGYATYLIKNNLAIEATPDALLKLENDKKAKKEAEEKKVEMIKKLQSEIESKSVVVKVQIGNDGRMFGSVTVKEIVEEFQKQNKIILDKRKVRLQSDITGVGIYVALVDLYPGIQAKFNVNVMEI